jgi:hypothetical protein
VEAKSIRQRTRTTVIDYGTHEKAWRVLEKHFPNDGQPFKLPSDHSSILHLKKCKLGNLGQTIS